MPKVAARASRLGSARSVLATSTGRCAAAGGPDLTLFTSKSVQQGTVIRRKRRDVERFVGMQAFLREVERRGFRVAENGGQLLIFCNRAPLRWLTAPPPMSLKDIGPKSFEDFGTRRP